MPNDLIKTPSPADSSGTVSTNSPPLQGMCVARLRPWQQGPAPEVVVDGGPPRQARLAHSVAPEDLRAAEDGAEVLVAVLADESASPVILALLRAVGDDGARRREIRAEDELVLRCGEARLILRRNGRVVLSGDYVETNSQGINRIKGASVQVN